jgi:energy-coupling factor transport system permease protein
MTIRETTKAIEKILTPLKIIKVDIESVSLMISISVSILPNLINEFEQKYYALKSKTIKITYKNLLLVVKTTLIEILLKSNAFEETLIVKGYGE